MNKYIIKYIGFYDLPNSKSHRVHNLAATNKMNYIASAINKAGYNVEIISPSWMGDKTKNRFERQRTVIINDKTKVTLCPSWKTKNKLTRNFKILFSLIWLFIYLLINTKRGEKIIAYHVQWISIPIRFAKLIKGFNLILEVEEIYGEVWTESQKLYRVEKELIDSADVYICVSDILKERLNRNRKKRTIVLYGSYEFFEDSVIQNKDTSTVHLVYAGSIDETKGGAFIAIRSMEYLPSNYKLSILGHGNENIIEKLQEQISRFNQNRKQETCRFVGILRGKEYSDYLFKCHIALNPQKQGEYMETAFPSKVISYLAHNLRVVSTEINSIKFSPLREFICFSQSDEPSCIAEAILNVDIGSIFNSTVFIKKLDENFICEISMILKGD